MSNFMNEVWPSRSFLRGLCSIVTSVFLGNTMIFQRSVIISMPYLESGVSVSNYSPWIVSVSANATYRISGRYSVVSLPSSNIGQCGRLWIPTQYLSCSVLSSCQFFALRFRNLVRPFCSSRAALTLGALSFPQIAGYTRSVNIVFRTPSFWSTTLHSRVSNTFHRCCCTSHQFPVMISGDNFGVLVHKRARSIQVTNTSSPLGNFSCRMEGLSNSCLYRPWALTSRHLTPFFIPGMRCSNFPFTSCGEEPTSTSVKIPPVYQVLQLVQILSEVSQ